MNLNIETAKFKRVVIIGGGFGGIETAKALKNTDYQIVLLDKHNYHTFQPLLYQVATGGLEPGSIAFPLRKFMQDIPNGIFRMAEVKKIDTEQNLLYTNIGELTYDYLVIATGSTTNFFAFPDEVKSKMREMKTIPQALDLRSFILENFEEALLTKDAAKREELVNIAIVGGGPTGVELAGALGEMRKNILPKDYPELDFTKMQIHLFESGNELLQAMSKENQEKALKYIREFGVNVWLNARVVDYDGETIKTDKGDKILAETLIWTAGVKGCIFEGLPKEAFIGNRLLVDAECKVNTTSNVYAIGDVACMPSEKNPKGHAMVAPVAIQQGELVGKNIKNNTHSTFTYFDKGSMATVGRNKAVMETKGLKMGGFLAWAAWLFVHVISLYGFRNKIAVVVSWIYNYFTYDRTLRLIIRPSKRKEL